MSLTGTHDRILPLATLHATEAAPALPAVIDAPRLPALAKSNEATALATVRTAADTFVKETGTFGNGNLGPVHRFNAAHAQKLAGMGLLGLFGTVFSGAGIIAFQIDVGLVGCLAAIAAMGIPLGTIVGGGLAEAVEDVIFRGRSLKQKNVQSLRDAFDAPGATPLQRAVIGLYAERALASLEARAIKGEAPRLLLQNIVNDAAALPEEARTEAAALMKCFSIVCNAQGKVATLLTERDVLKLEHALAESPEASRANIRDALKELLFKGEAVRTKMSDINEARLYRVLVGAEAPRENLLLAAPVLGAEELAREADELKSSLFVDGELNVRKLDQATAERLLSVLSSVDKTAR